MLCAAALGQLDGVVAGAAVARAPSTCLGGGRRGRSLGARTELVSCSRRSTRTSSVGSRRCCCPRGIELYRSDDFSLPRSAPLIFYLLSLLSAWHLPLLFLSSSSLPTVYQYPLVPAFPIHRH